MARIVICGYMIRHPVAGNLTAYFHYLLGLHRLGHEVMYVEESGWPQSCYNPITQEHGDDPAAGLRAVRSVMDRYSVPGPVAYVHRRSGRIEGMGEAELKRRLDTADLLINLGGVCWLPEFRRCRRRVLVDMDPFFTQVGEFGAEEFDTYHAYFSYGANIGRPQCSIPTGDTDWRPTVPPVVPDIWQTSPSDRPSNTECTDEAAAAFTTIANWSAYGGVLYEGMHYGQKDEEFLRLLDLPGHVSSRLELALSNADPDAERRLRAAGWILSDGGAVSTDLATYQRFIAGSRGEFSAAKNAYVKTRSGWFSDRSVCYLAAGRPVILQDTGFRDWLPTGRGVLAFSSPDEAVRCIEDVNAAYSAHCRAARQIAEKWFSYDVVLPPLVEAALAAPTPFSSAHLGSPDFS